MSREIIDFTKFIKKDWRYESMNKLMDSFMNYYENGFMEYFEEQRKKYLLEREDYQDLQNQIFSLMNKYPNIQIFLDNGENIDINNQERDALLTIIDLRETIISIELKETFKLGFKEAYIYFKEMNMLNVN